MIEEWKPVKGLENRYMVSNLGRIKSVDTTTNNGTQLRKGKLRKLSYDTYGYLRVSVIIDGKIKSLQVHRLVAGSFIPNLYNLPCINHKDENKSNNNINNLEWCTQKYNTNYGTRNERVSKLLKGKRINPSNSKPVLQIDKTTNLIIASYKSIDEAVRLCNFSTRSHISECCSQKTKRKTAHGFKWKYGSIPDLIRVQK